MKPGRRFNGRVWSRVSGKDFESTGVTLRCVESDFAGMVKLNVTTTLTRVEYNHTHVLIDHMLDWANLSEEVITLETR